MKKITRSQKERLILNLYRLCIENGMEHKIAYNHTRESLSSFIQRGTIAAVIYMYRTENNLIDVNKILTN